VFGCACGAPDDLGTRENTGEGGKRPALVRTRVVSWSLCKRNVDGESGECEAVFFRFD